MIWLIQSLDKQDFDHVQAQHKVFSACVVMYMTVAISEVRLSV